MSCRSSRKRSRAWTRSRRGRRITGCGSRARRRLRRRRSRSTSSRGRKRSGQRLPSEISPKAAGAAVTLKGATLGEWTNEPVVPGLNFGWAPAPSHLIVYAKRDGGTLMVLDDQGRKQELVGAKNAMLPGWSPDGKKL